MKRLYSEHAQIGAVQITDAELTHIYSARLRQGEEVTLINGDGNDYIGTLTEIGKRAAQITVTHTEPNRAEPEARLTLYIGNPKGDKLDIITQKLTELGAARIVPFTSQNVTAKPNSVNIPRLKRISIEAAKQCGGARFLDISPCISFAELLQNIKSHTHTLFPYENEKNTKLSTALANIDSATDIALVIGSEGGFTQAEAEQITSAGAIPVTLGNRILRCETAAISSSTLTLLK